TPAGGCRPRHHLFRTRAGAGTQLAKRDRAHDRRGSLMAAPGIVSPATWFDRAQRVTPGGVHSPVRAFTAMGTAPLAIVDAHGAHVVDADGRRYIDWIGAWGPALLGHGHRGIED